MAKRTKQIYVAVLLVVFVGAGAALAWRQVKERQQRQADEEKVALLQEQSRFLERLNDLLGDAQGGALSEQEVAQLQSILSEVFPDLPKLPTGSIRTMPLEEFRQLSQNQKADYLDRLNRIQGIVKNVWDRIERIGESVDRWEAEGGVDRYKAQGHGLKKDVVPRYQLGRHTSTVFLLMAMEQLSDVIEKATKELPKKDAGQ